MSITKVIQLTMTRCELDQTQFPGMYVEAIPDRDTPGAVELYLYHIGDQFDTRNFMTSFVPNEERTIESEIESTIDYYAEELAKELDADGILPDNLFHLLSDDECDSDECDCNEGDCDCADCDCNEGDGDYDCDCDCADCNCNSGPQDATINTTGYDNISGGEAIPYLYFGLDQQKFPGLSVNVIPRDNTPGEHDVFLRHEGAEPFYMFTAQTRNIDEIMELIDADIDDYAAMFRKQFPETTDDRIVVFMSCECPYKDRNDDCDHCNPCAYCNHPSPEERDSGEQKGSCRLHNKG
jgi:hypothetical protein